MSWSFMDEIIQSKIKSSIVEIICTLASKSLGKQFQYLIIEDQQRSELKSLVQMLVQLIDLSMTQLSNIWP